MFVKKEVVFQTKVGKTYVYLDRIVFQGQRTHTPIRLLYKKAYEMSLMKEGRVLYYVVGRCIKQVVSLLQVNYLQSLD